MRVEATQKTSFNSTARRERTSNRQHLQQSPILPATVSDTSSLLSTPSTLSEILDPNEQAYILSITARIKANMEHSDRAREATQLVLDTIQMEDASAHFLPKLPKQGNVTLPALKSSSVQRRVVRFTFLFRCPVVYVHFHHFW